MRYNIKYSIGGASELAILKLKDEILTLERTLEEKRKELKKEEEKKKELVEEGEKKKELVEEGEKKKEVVEEVVEEVKGEKLGQILEYSKFPELTALQILMKILKNSIVCPDMDPRLMKLEGYNQESKDLATALDENFSVHLIKEGRFTFRPDECALFQKQVKFSNDDDKIFIYVLGITLVWMVSRRLPIPLAGPKGKIKTKDFIVELNKDDFRKDASKPFKEFANKLIKQASDTSLVGYTRKDVINDLTGLIKSYGGDYTIGFTESEAYSLKANNYVVRTPVSTP